MNKAIEVIAIVTVLAAGVAARLANLAGSPLIADEAEAALNAITILEHGFPSSHYLGLPLYDNTLVEPWPAHPEYEFRDSSYSVKGVAVYHGWLPLYAIAASLTAFGIAPDKPGSKQPRDSASRIQRTFAARFPSVLAGAVLLLLLFLAAREIFGRDAAWAAICLGAFADAVVQCNRQAYYYSFALLASVLSGWLTWRAVVRPSIGRFLVVAVSLVLLFHTHFILFAAHCALFAAASLVRGWDRRLGVMAAMTLIVAAGTAPWALASGFLDTTGSIPRARPLVALSDLASYPAKELRYAIPCATALLLVAVSTHRLTAVWLGRARDPLRSVVRPSIFVAAWLVCAYCAFVILVPACSFGMDRLPSIVAGPGILITAMLAACIARSLPFGNSSAVAAALAVLLVTCTGATYPFTAEAPPGFGAFGVLLDRIEELPLDSHARLYAVPNVHLQLTYYSGRPVQSAAPVRKTFFDSYPGQVVLFAPVPFLTYQSDPLGPWNVRAAARRHGIDLDRDEAARLSENLGTADFRHQLAGRVRQVDPAPVDVPPYVRSLIPLQRELNQRRLGEVRKRAESMPATRGFVVDDDSDMWWVYFYRFVDPNARRGPKQNYADRIRTSTASVIAGSWVIYNCPGQKPGNAQGNL